MKQYMLSVHDIEGQPVPPPEEVQQLYAGVAAFNDELQADGAWVFAGGSSSWAHVGDLLLVC